MGLRYHAFLINNAPNPRNRVLKMPIPSFKDLDKACEVFAQKLRDETDPLGYGPDSDDTMIDAATQQFRSVAIATDKVARVRALALAYSVRGTRTAELVRDVLSIVGPE